jgi:hypothetical protein
MSHGIILPIDQVFSTKSAEWHGLATVVPAITREVASSTFFKIATGDITVNLADGRSVVMPHHKPLVADFSECRPDLVGTEFELHPLHIPRKSYREITNEEVWNTMEKAVKDVDATISALGTLEGGKKFFVSLDLNQETESIVNGDKFLSHLNLITSHDGTLAAEAYDSTIRIVCMNTLRWSRQAAGEVGFKVYHTQGADVAMPRMGELVNAILLGRAEFRNAMEYLATVPCTATEARQIALGYLSSLNTNKKEVAKRTLNAAEEIANLFARGKGNNGRNLYDLLNGVTEYYTHGDGTGKKSDAATKAYKAEFGSAAEHKEAFSNLLLVPSEVEKLKEAGKAAELGSTL